MSPETLRRIGPGTWCRCISFIAEFAVRTLSARWWSSLQETTNNTVTSAYRFTISPSLHLIRPSCSSPTWVAHERFWHLFFYVNGGIPYINLQSPLSVGLGAIAV